MKFKLSFGFLILIAIGVKSVIAETPDELRAIFKEWVAVKKITSEEASEWKVEKAVIADMLKVLEQEEVDLTERIEENESFLSTADEKRTNLEDQRGALLQASSTLEESLPGLESQVRALYARFPEPLQQTVQPLYNRIPTEEEPGNLPSSQRLQSIVGILSQADKFNSGVTVITELRESDGATVEVKTLYFGLGGAIYADASGASAGYGVPNAEGWEWIESEENRADIVNAIEVYQGINEAGFTPVPVQIK